MSNKWQSRSRHPSYKFAGSKPKRVRIPKQAWIIPLAVVGIFVLANLITFALYSGRTYPRTKVMNTTIGSVAFGKLDEKVSRQNVLPEVVTLQHSNKNISLKLKDLGISASSQRAIQNAKKQRHWLPIANFFSSPVLLAPVAIDAKTFTAKSQELAQNFKADPINPKLSLQDGMLSVLDGTDGYNLLQNDLQRTILTALDKGKVTITVPAKTLPPTVTKADLQGDLQNLEKQLATSLQFRYNGTTRQATRADIASWYIPSGQTYTLGNDRVLTYLTTLGKSFAITIKDRSQIATSITNALTGNKPLDIALSAVTASKTYKYCTATRGVDASEMPTLRTMLDATYSDGRGWSLSDKIDFTYVASGCDFTVWLSAANQMPSFGAICDSDWSCRVGPNVVINFDRWQGASTAWNEYGGSLTDYRHMVINHETGHWLGFAHATCAGAGQVAAVMQQQSISLQGCKFNPWPTAGEQATLRSRLGI